MKAEEKTDRDLPVKVAPRTSLVFLESPWTLYRLVLDLGGFSHASLVSRRPSARWLGGGGADPRSPRGGV